MNNEVIWAAGFFDGEGTIVIAGRYPNSLVIQIRVVQKDIRPLVRFQNAVGCGNISIGRISRWQIAGKRAMSVMDVLYPYLSEPKKEQYERKMEELRKG